MARIEDAIDEGGGGGAERAVLLEEIDLDVEAREALVEGAAEGALPLLPALAGDDGGGHERAGDGAAAGRAPEAGAAAVAEEHHDLDVADAAKRLREALDPGRRRALQDGARDAGEGVGALAEVGAHAGGVEGPARGEVDAAEALDGPVGGEARAEGGLLVGARAGGDQERVDVRVAHGGDDVGATAGVEGVGEGGGGDEGRARKARGADVEARVVADEGDPAAALEVLGQQRVGCGAAEPAPGEHAADGEQQPEDGEGDRARHVRGVAARPRDVDRRAPGGPASRSATGF
ncbi:MAG: hypothetical protein CMN29_16685 [Sandaracinus sp.]|nr:hypothetical protein [Myxococcales bacterium]MAT26569.1 hypothetical protein [Sandaracinus sp.]